MKLAINPETTVGALLEAYPNAEEVLVDLAPAFAKLRNPVVRRTVAKVATLEQAARIGGVSLQTMVQKLRAFTGAGGCEVVTGQAPEAAGGLPAWAVQGRIVREIDAGPMLERGIHPIGEVRAAVQALAPGEVIVLRTSFVPAPLIETMRRAGTRVHGAAQGEDFVTYFCLAGESACPTSALRNRSELQNGTSPDRPETALPR